MNYWDKWSSERTAEDSLCSAEQIEAVRSSVHVLLMSEAHKSLLAFKTHTKKHQCRILCNSRCVWLYRMHFKMTSCLRRSTEIQRWHYAVISYNVASGTPVCQSSQMRLSLPTLCSVSWPLLNTTGYQNHNLFHSTFIVQWKTQGYIKTEYSRLTKAHPTKLSQDKKELQKIRQDYKRKWHDTLQKSNQK